jgi:hypothetical protein
MRIAIGRRFLSVLIHDVTWHARLFAGIPAGMRFPDGSDPVVSLRSTTRYTLPAFRAVTRMFVV